MSGTSCGESRSKGEATRNQVCVYSVLWRWSQFSNTFLCVWYGSRHSQHSRPLMLGSCMQIYDHGCVIATFCIQNMVQYASVKGDGCTAEFSTSIHFWRQILVSWEGHNLFSLSHWSITAAAKTKIMSDIPPTMAKHELFSKYEYCPHKQTPDAQFPEVRVIQLSHGLVCVYDISGNDADAQSWVVCANFEEWTLKERLCTAKIAD
jgi:hypothetical protein